MRYSTNKIDLEKAVNSSNLAGHLAVDIHKSIDKHAKNIRCFGVGKEGAAASGKGVLATKIIRQENKQRALFSITKLIQKSQFSNDTKELIIKVDSREVCRKKIADFPCPYF